MIYSVKMKSAKDRASQVSPESMSREVADEDAHALHFQISPALMLDGLLATH